MKQLIFCIAFLAAVGVATAQNAPVGIEEASDPRATKILNSIKAKYDSYKTMEARFTLTIELPESPPEIQKGMIVQKGEKYWLDMGEQAVICDGKYLWLHLKRQNEVQINDLEEQEDLEMISPKDLLKIYESNQFIYALTNETFVKGKAVQEIEFKPIDKDSDYTKMRLTLEKKSQQVDHLKVFARDGSRYTLKFDQLTPNKSYADDYFVFDSSKYPGISVEDLRID